MVPLWYFTLTFIVFKINASRLTPELLNSSKTFNVRCDRPNSKTSKRIKLYVSGFFPMTGDVESHWSYKSVIMPAVDLALKDIERHPCILKGYSLVIERKDTQVRYHFVTRCVTLSTTML